MTTEQGKTYVEQHRNEFTEFMWQIWSPNYKLDATGKETLARFIENEDWSAVTLDCYRSRWGYAPRDGFYAPLQAQIANDSSIFVPTLNIVGADDPCTDTSMLTNMDQYFDASFTQEFWPNVGILFKEKYQRSWFLAV